MEAFAGMLVDSRIEGRMFMGDMGEVDAVGDDVPVGIWSLGGCGRDVRILVAGRIPGGV